MQCHILAALIGLFSVVDAQAHIGIIGNETVDVLAMEAANVMPTPDTYQGYVY